MGEVHRQLVAVAEQVGVDAAGIDFEEGLHARRGGLVQHLGALPQVHRAHEAVHFQHARTGHFGQAPFGHQAQADHLAEAVAGVYIAQGKQGIVEAVGFDQWHAEAVTPDRDAAGQPLDRHDALLRRQAVAVAAVEKRLAATDKQAGTQGGEQAHFGQGAEGRR